MDEADSTSGSEYFAESATVLDEGEALVGRHEIEAWMKQTHAKYKQTTEPLSFKKTGDAGVMTAKVSGTFPGSPVVLSFQLKFDDGLIADLRVV